MKVRALLATALLCIAAPAVSQEPQVREMFAEYITFHNNWAEAVVAAQVVARVRLLDTQYRVVDSLVITQYTAEVLEYIKSEGAGTRTLQIYRLGGVTRESGREVKYVVRGYPDFSVGEEYLLFLNWNRAVAAFATRGPELTFRLDRVTGRVYTPGTSEFARRQHERKIESMMAHVRRISR